MLYILLQAKPRLYVYYGPVGFEEDKQNQDSLYILLQTKI